MKRHFHQLALAAFVIAVICAHGGAVRGSVPLQITAEPSATEIVQGDALSLAVTVRNTGATAVRVLPLNRNIWDPYRLVFDQPPAGDEGRTHMPVGSEPQIGGLTAIVPVLVDAEKSIDGRIDLLAPQCLVYPRDSEGRLLFTMPGSWTLRVRYRIDVRMARAFSLEVCEIDSEPITIVVNPLPDPKPGGMRWTSRWAPWFIDIDGRVMPRPAAVETIDAQRREEIFEAFKEVVELDRSPGRYGEGPVGSVRFEFHAANDGMVYFAPSVLRSTHEMFAASPELMQALQTRMFTIQVALSERSIKSTPTGRWGYVEEVCGNDWR